MIHITNLNLGQVKIILCNNLYLYSSFSSELKVVLRYYLVSSHNILVKETW